MLNKAYRFRPCPHCGELMRPGTIARHTPYCIKNPDIYARLREVLTSDDGEHGITSGRYVELHTADKTLLSIRVLFNRTKSTAWGGVLAFFKLSPPLPEACRQQCPRCGKLIAGGKMTEHQAACQEHKPKRTSKPKPQPQPVALAVAPVVEPVTVPLPRITPTASKWAGLKGYDPTWKAPTGDTQWLVMVQPGERTCLACGDTFAAGGYCMRCGTRDDGTRRSKDDMPPSVPTASYLHADEYVTVH